MTAVVDELLAGVAAHGLPGSRPQLAPHPLASHDWAALLGRVRAERIPGLLLAALADEALPATDGQWEQAIEAHAASMSSALVLERELLATVELFRRAGVDHRVLKGSAVAHLDYPDPSWRSFGDVDLLVPAERFDLAVELLLAKGYRREFPQPRAGFDRRFTKGTSLVTERGRDLDVHRTFVAGPFGLTVHLPDLFATSAPFEVAGTKLLALGAEERFLHACFHAALGDVPPRLCALRDVAQMLLHTSLSVDRAHELARSWKAASVVARAVSLAWETLRLPEEVPLSSWASRYRPSRWERRALRVYTDESCSYPAQAAAAVLAIPNLTDRVAYVRALLFPDRTYLASRDHGYVQRLKRSARVFVTWALRP